VWSRRQHVRGMERADRRLQPTPLGWRNATAGEYVGAAALRPRVRARTGVRQPVQARAYSVACATRRRVGWASVSAEWTAPAVKRADPDHVADERTALEQWLDHHRDILQTKCAGLTAGQLKRRAVPPSNLSLLGLVRHMADVERGWFRQCAAGEDVADLYWTEADHDADFNDIEAADAQADLDTYRREIAAARAGVAGSGLDDVVSHPLVSGDRDIRWIYVHMIEEYARHNGHADLIRECIDGVTGD